MLKEIQFYKVYAAFECALQLHVRGGCGSRVFWGHGRVWWSYEEGVVIL